MKDKAYIFGLILVILSFIASTISYYLIIFAIPIFIIGAIAIFFSKKKLAIKLITVIIPLVLYLPSTYLFLSLYGRTTPVTFLIPADYEGQFCVVYGEKCGANPTYENGRMVLNIPYNGIIIIQPKFETGIVNHEYYLVNKNGSRKKINALMDYKQRTTESPGVLLGGSGSMAGAMPDGSSSSESPLAIHFTDFTVYNKDTTEKDERVEYRLQQRFDSLTNALVNACREK